MVSALSYRCGYARQRQPVLEQRLIRESNDQFRLGRSGKACLSRNLFAVTHEVTIVSGEMLETGCFVPNYPKSGPFV